MANNGIVLVNPSYAIVPPLTATSALDLLRNDFPNVIFRQDILSRSGLFAGTQERRQQELAEALRFKKARFVWAGRGGYGLTPLLNSELVNGFSRRKLIPIGFSDTTALLAPVAEKGLAIHGPHWGAYSGLSSHEKRFLRTLFEEGVISRRAFRLRVLRPASTTIKVRAVTGGNLSMLCCLLGTRLQPTFTKKVVFLEDIGEKAYRLDRMLVQLLQATDIQKASAIVLGDFKGWRQKGWRGSLGSLFADRLPNIPIFEGLKCGHIKDNRFIPMGVDASISPHGEMEIPSVIIS